LNPTPATKEARGHGLRARAFSVWGNAARLHWINKAEGHRHNTARIAFMSGW